VGYHFEGDAANIAAQAARGTRVGILTPADQNGVYEALGLHIQGIGKRISSFFPRSWSRTAVIRAVNEGWATRIAQGGNAFQGRSSSGVLIKYYLVQQGPRTGIIDSAFPIIRG